MAARLEKFEERAAFRDGAVQALFYTNLVSLLDYADGGYVIFDEPAVQANTSGHSSMTSRSLTRGSWRRAACCPALPTTTMTGQVFLAARRHHLLYLAALSRGLQE